MDEHGHEQARAGRRAAQGRAGTSNRSRSCAKRDRVRCGRCSRRWLWPLVPWWSRPLMTTVTSDRVCPSTWRGRHLCRVAARPPPTRRCSRGSPTCRATTCRPSAARPPPTAWPATSTRTRSAGSPTPSASMVPCSRAPTERGRSRARPVAGSSTSTRGAAPIGATPPRGTAGPWPTTPSPAPATEPRRPAGRPEPPRATAISGLIRVHRHDRRRRPALRRGQGLRDESPTTTVHGGRSPERAP